MFLKKVIKKVINRLKYGVRATSESYISYLKNKGVLIGNGTILFDPNLQL